MKIGVEAGALLLRKALVWDNMLPWQAGRDGTASDFTRFKDAGVDFVSITVAARDSDLQQTTRTIAQIHAQTRLRFDDVAFVSSVREIDKAKACSKLAVGFNLQETIPFGEHLENIELFYRLGVRQALLAYNSKNYVGDGCAERTDSGLSRFGVQVIREMNRLGMVVDGKHPAGAALLGSTRG